MNIDNSIQMFNINKSSLFGKGDDLQKSNKTDRTDYFGKFFDEALKIVDKTNDMQINAENRQIDFITGKSDDIISLVMAESKANSAVQFTSQITSKILNAYQEIIRIPI